MKIAEGRLKAGLYELDKRTGGPVIECIQCFAAESTLAVWVKPVRRGGRLPSGWLGLFRIVNRFYEDHVREDDF